jgi:hypothetical protein
VVLALKVGRQRKPAVGFGLALATFNVYSYYWDYKAHRELFDQFELARDGRTDGGFWYFLSTALPVLRFPYHYAVVGNVQYLRQRLGLRLGITPGGFLAFTIPAVSVLLIGYVVGSVLLFNAEDTHDPRLAWGIGVLLGGLVVYAILETLAYVRLQRDINGVWDAYDHRAAQLTAARPAAPAMSAAAQGWTVVDEPAPSAVPSRATPRPPAPARPASPRARAGGATASARAPKPPAPDASTRRPAAPPAPRRRPPP